MAGGGARCWPGSATLTAARSFADPRALLGQVAGRFETLGLQPVCALELEFYLVDQRPGRDGPGAPAAPPGRGREGA